MKNKYFVLSALILSIIFVSGISFAASGTSSIYVSVAKYEPFPAEAGQYLDIWFKLENTGADAANGAVMELLPAFPFSLETGDAIKSLGAVPSGSAELIKYRVKVDEKATSGDNILQVRYKPGTLSEWVTKDADISIQVHDAVLSIDGISSAEMTPGNARTVTISLENMADTYLKDISAVFEFSSATLPFATLGSINEKRIVSMPAKGKANVSFDIITSPDAASGVYKVPITLSYSDTTNKKYTREYTIGFVVNSRPDFQIGLQKYDAMTEGSTGTVTVSISNTGPGTIKFMSMDLLPSVGYEIFGEKSIYLGNLNSDDYQTGSFKIYVKPGVLGESKTLPLKISLKYRDGLNNVYSKDVSLDLRVYTQSEIKSYGLAPASGSSTTIYVIIAAVIIYYLYRKYYKKKAKI